MLTYSITFLHKLSATCSNYSHLMLMEILAKSCGISTRTNIFVLVQSLSFDVCDYLTYTKTFLNKPYVTYSH